MVRGMRISDRPIVIATRGSALALAQANDIREKCQALFPLVAFELKVMKTTGDRLQRASLARPAGSLPKGLFTKELEMALLAEEADLAVHSLKDLPTELPTGLRLGAVSRRADVRDALIYRGAKAYSSVSARGRSGVPRTVQGRVFEPGLTVEGLPSGATVATSSTRRGSQLLAIRPDLNVVEIRGNVATRLRKLVEQAGMDATILAAAGLERLRIEVRPGGELAGGGLSEGFLASVLSVETMLPCVGQGALGIEVRVDDERVAGMCARLDHDETHRCVLAERAFLHAMGGGCQSPVGALAELRNGRLRLRAVSFQGGRRTGGEVVGAAIDAEALGQELAARLRAH
jgi:hydroxymethylbilane synthase